MPHKKWTQTKVSLSFVVLIIISVATAIAVYWIETAPVAPDINVLVLARGTNGWKIYKNESFGFLFKYPPRFQIKESVDAANGLLINFLGNNQQPDNTLTVAVNKITKTGLCDPKTFFDSQKTRMSGNLSSENAALLDNKEVNAWQTVMIDKNVRNIVTYIVNKDCAQMKDREIILASYSGPADQPQTYRVNEYNLLVSSFRIIQKI